MAAAYHRSEGGVVENGMTATLAESFQYCRRVTRNRARNFYYSFVLLRREEHDAMCAVYAFMRYCDDLSDDCSCGSEQARALMERWRADLGAALEGRPGPHPVWPAFCSVVQRYGIPHRYFRDMIDGVASDLEPGEFKTFEELYGYCYQVASVAGLSVVHILGFESQAALELAEKCGVAFQLTNILRDVREDAGCGRVYLPTQDLERFGLTRQEVLAAQDSLALRRLLSFEAARATEYFAESGPLVSLVSRRNQAALWALIEIYRRLLKKIERSNFDVLNGRISLTAWEKCRVVARAAAGSLINLRPAR
jgi:15-cis-phytoene synthase